MVTIKKWKSERKLKVRYILIREPWLGLYYLEQYIFYPFKLYNDFYNFKT